MALFPAISKFKMKLRELEKAQYYFYKNNLYMETYGIIENDTYRN